MVDIEKVKAFKNIAPYLNDKDRKELVDKLCINDSNLPLRLSGLRNEDELCLILSYLNSCDHILSFDEGISILTKSYQPDLLIKLKNKNPLFIEVKSKQDYIFKISKGNLENKIKFVKYFNIPLYFALKLNGSWSLFTSEYLLSNSGKINIVEQREHSKFGDFFQSYHYLFFKGIESIHKYSLSNNSQIKHSKYGNLIAFELSFNNRKIVDVNKYDSNFFLSFIFKSLFNAMQIAKEETDGNVTKIYRRLNHNTFIADYHFFIEQIRSIVNEYGSRHDTTSYLKLFLENREHLINHEMLLHGLRILQNKGLPIQILRIL